MWYKFENENWQFAENSVTFPDGFELKNDLTAERDGWKWFDEEPLEYTEWYELNNPPI